MSVRIITGDCRDVLRTLPDASAQSCVTSPPYWRQRDYNMREQIGLEQTPEQFVAELVDVFREVRRVLRDDGICWINIGDKWVSGGNGGGGSFMAQREDAWSHAKNATGWRKPPPGYKDKDLVGLPFMLAFALRADGWFWRHTIIWAKKNGMPESVSDRPTNSHEYVLLFSKSNDYYYNTDEARTPIQPSSATRLAQNVEQQEGSARANGGAKTNGKMKAVSREAYADARFVAGAAVGLNQRKHGQYETANLRSVWWLSTANCAEAHFAVMPEELAEICVASSSPIGGVVLDPFGGAGTTGLVADRLQRSAVLIELNPEYADIARRRVSGDAPLFAEVGT